MVPYLAYRHVTGPTFRSNEEYGVRQLRIIQTVIVECAAIRIVERIIDCCLVIPGVDDVTNVSIYDAGRTSFYYLCQ